MTALQISTLLHKAGHTKAGYAPGQRVRFRRPGYIVRMVAGIVRVDYIPGSDQQHSDSIAALTDYRQSIEAAGYSVETVDTGWSQYLIVTER